MNTFWFPKTSFHDPEYVPVVYEFETTTDLLALEAVRRYDSPGAKFCMSDSHLMVVTRDGFEWWVVGRIGEPHKVDLPTWEGPKVRIRFTDGTEAVVSKEIHSMCGDLITLRDGTKATTTPTTRRLASSPDLTIRRESDTLFPCVDYWFYSPLY
jgi:hypothetical protein